MRTVVVGLGNPILSDDSVGIKVASLLKERLTGFTGVEVVEAYAGGLRLVEAMAGYRRALIVDAVKTGVHPPGTLLRFRPGGCDATRNLLCTHDGDLETALAVGRELGLELPEELEILGIEAAEVETFSEELTGEVAAALPAAVTEIMRILGLVAVVDAG